MRGIVAEKKAIARQMAEDGMKQSEIAEWLKVSSATLSRWVSDITQRQDRNRDAFIWWLDSLGWTHQGEIEGHANIDIGRQRIDGVALLYSKWKKVAQDQSARGRTPEQIAETEGVPVALVEVALLDGKDDDERLGWIQEEIAARDGRDQGNISRAVCEFSELKKVTVDIFGPKKGGDNWEA